MTLPRSESEERSFDLADESLTAHDRVVYHADYDGGDGSDQLKS